MIRSTPNSLASAILLFSGMCCMGRYSAPKLVPVVKPDPAQDFARLRKLLVAMDGELVCSDDDFVTWEDTSIFRVFELKHHTVVIFPCNWDASVYNIIIFAGRIKPGLDPYDAIQFKFVSGPGAHCWNTGIEWNPDDPLLKSVHFADLRLGEAEVEAVQTQERYIRRSGQDVHEQNIEIGVLAGWQGWLEARRADTHVGMACIDGRLAYIDINPEGRATLAGLAIRHPKAPVLAQGTFSLTE